MRITVLIEGITLLLISLAAMVEGIRLIIYKNPEALYDKLGPGFYVVILSIALMPVGVAYLFLNYRKDPNMGKVMLGREVRIRVISMIMVCAIYIFLINIVGYLAATIPFFLMAFKVAGFRSWLKNFICSLVVTAVFYMLFVEYFNLVFPRGILFR